MGKLNPGAAPKDPISDLRREVAQLRAEVNRLRSSAELLQHAEIGRGGVIVRGEGGIRMIAPDGTTIFEVVCDPSTPDPDGNAQPSMFLNRNDGTVAMSLNDPLPGTDGYHQFIRFFDRAGNEIFAEDATAGKGVANPWLPFSMFPARYTDWPKSISGTFETIWQGGFWVKNPTITLGATWTSDATDTTGEVRFQVNGTTVGTTQAFGFGIGNDYLAHQLPLPAGTDINAWALVTLQVHRTAGTGNVMAAPIVVTGSQSP